MRRFLAPATVLLLAAASWADDPTPLEKALAAFREGDYATAAAEAQEVPASDPLYPKARYVVAESWLALGDGESAEGVFRELLAKKPDSVPLLAGLGRALAARGKVDEGLEALRKAVRFDPRDAGARRALGEILAANGKPTEGRKELEQAAKVDPKDPLTARALVELLLKAGDLASASRAADVHRAADPKSAMGDFLRGLVHDRDGKSREAIEFYEAALAKDPKFLDAHKNLAILCVADNPLYKDRERTKKALEHFAKYFELGGKDEELRKTYETIRSFLESLEKKGEK